jgi:DNA-3-methyladenine glycosylase II
LTPGARFPTPEQMLDFAEADLRAVGLSGQKTSYVKDLAARVQDGRLQLNRLRRLDDAAVIDQLTQVRGIGVWSAQMHLMFHLGRLDVLPTGDLGLQIACSKAYGLGEKYASPVQMEELGQKWAPYRSIASWYLWRSLDQGGL